MGRVGGHAARSRTPSRRVGFVHVAGVDEVGRGCLAGPVVAGAVILHPDRPIRGLADSKLVPPAERGAPAPSVDRGPRRRMGRRARSGPADIDRMSIHRASLESMRRAVLALAPLPDVVLVDAFRIPGLAVAQRGIVHGDRRCAAIAAASIVAKVHRDRLMVELARAGPPVRVCAAQGLRDARASGGRRALRLLAPSPPLVPAAVAV